ncbi:APC family permease [Planosporangium mesophilum]|uniref:Amino acid permease n=1 Tax=Planosporangium mesophilum TaxID=689768 RepID=A0A8J3TJG7_9ACTN|nr:APC family permease [Planosporangium mesophilum]NJC83726.1 APC family permease [Planosporangium mesophilum]GII26307.1 amino acid permease [Planosporangium mesophilum]
MATATPVATGNQASSGHLRRDVGFWGLTFMSLGSIIGSGWLLGALGAAQVAGPASLLSWILAGAMLAVLALAHAELGATYPVAAGTARFPRFAFGRLAGFVAGWASWLQAVTITPIEVEASLQYLNNIEWVKSHLHLLSERGTLSANGLIGATVLMLLFTVINIVGVKLLAESNAAMVVWKTAIPVVTVVVLLTLTFHGGNFTAGGGFAPYGAHGVFAALPAGVVFALQGFEQAIQMGGEARNPQRDISRAVIFAMLVGTAIYILLEIAFIGSLDPRNLVTGWAHPVKAGDFGPYATLALGAGAGWLAYLLYIDAFLSPAGAGLVYVGTSSRVSYALGRERALPAALGRLNSRGVPLRTILLAFVVGELAFLPFPSWQSLVGLVTSATAIMYAFAPVSLAALRRRDPERHRPYRLPGAVVTAPLGFVAANLVIYWGGFEATWKLVVAIVLGFVIYQATAARTPRVDRSRTDWRSAVWIGPWLAGLTVIGFVGRYGHGARLYLPEWVDLAVVVAFSLAIFFFAVNVAMAGGRVKAAVEAETGGATDQREFEPA